MPRVTLYGSGGYDASKPNGNVIEERDEPDAPPPPSADERLAAAVAALAGLDGIAAPVLAADVLDTLADLRAALEG